jgi:hypothetical protein
MQLMESFDVRPFRFIQLLQALDWCGVGIGRDCVGRLQ